MRKKCIKLKKVNYGQFSKRNPFQNFFSKKKKNHMKFYKNLFLKIFGLRNFF